MKYQFIGPKIPYRGKTLWEIVANLKDFGVGRLIKAHTPEKVEEPSFLKIIKIQALPPSKQPFEERFVRAWVEEISGGVNTGMKFIKMTKYPMYSLIPKIEEEKYYKACEELDEEKKKKYVCKYCSWPPLYESIWEKTQKYYGPLPKLNAVMPDYKGFEVVVEEKPYPTKTCSLYKSELSVEEMYKEIVQLKKLIKSNSEAS